MLSMGKVSSAAGAANYFAKDDYYVGDGVGERSEWGGKGAEELGLSGEVSKQDFERLLDGKLPDGTVVNAHENRQAGTDLTFSAPKSFSLLAQLKGGDDRLQEALWKAAKQTMAFAEKHYAEVRSYERNSNGEGVKTSNLVYAMFHHDTSRKLDPQNHVHAVVAAMSQDQNGKWKALWNNPLWQNNTVLGSVFHGQLREEVEKLGYKTELTGKHGQFEIKGVGRDIIEAFSQRRMDVLEKVRELGITTPEGRNAVVINTRDPKLNADDKEALQAEWNNRAKELGFDPKSVVDAAKARSMTTPEGHIRTQHKLREVISSVRSFADLYLRPKDDLTTKGPARLLMTPTAVRSEIAAASAIRILGERETSWSKGALVKSALDLGIKSVTAQSVENRLDQLISHGKLIEGAKNPLDKSVSAYTTPEHIAIERATLANIDKGRGASNGIIGAADAKDRLNQVSGEHKLNSEQATAGTVALSSNDRTVVIQGVAGAGKTTLISSIASVAHQEGKEVVGLAFANKMVSDLRNDTQIRRPDGEMIQGGIEAKTVSSFVNEHLRGALKGSGDKFEASKEALKDKILVLDEASLVANKPMNDLLTIANKLGVEKLIIIGDKNQLSSIEHGKSMALILSDKPAMATLETSIRQRTDEMKQVASLARAGKFAESFAVLGDKVIEGGKNHLEITASKWLELSKEDRDRTAIYSSGRDARATINELVQEGLKSEGTIKGEGIGVTTLLPAHATREELRYAHTYKAGHVLEVMRHNAPQGLQKGKYDVIKVDENGRVTLKDENGRQKTFKPQKIDPLDKRDALQLSEKHHDKLYEGDKIRWTAKDDERGLMKSEEAKILGVENGIVKIENKNGDIVELQKNDKMLERLGLAYAINMHQAQGDTKDHGIGEMHSAARNLSNQRLALVMMTRQRDGLTVVTNDKEKLLSQLGNNRGDKTSALETIGEKTIDAKAPSSKLPHFNPKIPENIKNSPAVESGLPKLDSGSMRPAPQLDLPEKNIERSR